MLQVTKTDITGMVDRLCALSHADRATAMNALRSAMQGHTEDMHATMNCAADMLLNGSGSKAQH